MEINQTKCDQCGKLQNKPFMLGCGPDILTVGLRTATTKVNGYFYQHSYDFCSEDCLREFLVKRHSAASAMISPEYLKTA